MSTYFRFVVTPTSVTLKTTDYYPARLTRTQALPLSIAKWEALVEWLRTHPRLAPKKVLNDGTSETCALCRVYRDRSDKVDCEQCPVAQKTEKAYCRDTPYDLWCTAPTLAHAEAEVAFLRSLKTRRPATRTKPGRKRKG